MTVQFLPSPIPNGATEFEHAMIGPRTQVHLLDRSAQTCCISAGPMSPLTRMSEAPWARFSGAACAACTFLIHKSVARMACQ